MKNSSVIIGVICILFSIILGAFGAHSLKELITQEKIHPPRRIEVGVRYQMYHGLALLIIGLNADKIPFSLKSFQWLILFGTILFSFSIYPLALQDLISFSLTFLGPVTPIGGGLLIIGWLIFLVNLFRRRGRSRPASTK